MSNEIYSTLCQDCGKACGDCSWSADFIPVKGWVAEPNKIKQTKYEYDSFNVKSCPLFEQDKPLEVMPHYDNLLLMLKGIIHYALMERRRYIEKRPDNFEELKELIDREIEVRQIDEWLKSGCGGLINESLGVKLANDEKYGRRNAECVMMGDDFRVKVLSLLKKAVADIKHKPCFSCNKKLCDRCHNYNKFVWRRLDEDM